MSDTDFDREYLAFFESAQAEVAWLLGLLKKARSVSRDAKKRHAAAIAGLSKTRQAGLPAAQKEVSCAEGAVYDSKMESRIANLEHKAALDKLATTTREIFDPIHAAGGLLSGAEGGEE